MSFFDKFFSHKNRNNRNENALKTETETLSFRSSYLYISKDQIRFILFRECDRRGRKLLFDSNAVEKLPLPSAGIMSNKKCQQQNEKIIDFIETTTTHGYKYKKPSSDVSCLGEMIFGSVAMMYKGGVSCKIHSIPSPKQLMFSTIVHAPSRCPVNTTSECSTEETSRGSSLGSLLEVIDQKQTSSSDSKLYRREGVDQKYSSTYPWIKHNSPENRLTQCCEISDIDSKLANKPFPMNDSEVKCLGGLCVGNNQTAGCNLVQEEKSSGFSSSSDQYGEKDSNSNLGSSVVTSLESENVSSISSSLSSLRRRWVQSYMSSLDSVAYENTSSSPCKKKTKLGMALVLNLSNTLEDEMEKFLFNHTIVMDSIMSKLQSSVELAYVKNENFVDLIYSAFQESQQSIHELITGGKYETPIWCTLIGSSAENFETPILGRSLYEENIRACKKQDALESVQLKFLNDFCDVLIKFDTKDTNFFISTLLTAVLTHHLSWVTSIAETDSYTPHQKLSVIKNSRPYNPIWAQLNDLCGLLGSPLKCAKTVITGPESKKAHIATIVQVLTYFIRCYNVVENIYDIEIEEVISNADLEGKKFMENLDSDIESDSHISSSVEVKKTDKKRINSRVRLNNENEKSSDEELEYRKKESDVLLSRENTKDLGNTGGGLKRSKSYLSHMKEKSSSPVKLYPDIKDLAKTENVNVEDLNYSENDQTVFVDNLLNSKKTLKVPERGVSSHLEGYLSPDEGYDTIDSTKTENNCGEKVHREAQEDRKEDIVFVLGENEELVNLSKKVIVTKASLINLEKEEDREDSLDVCDRVAAVSVDSENKFEKDSRTSRKISERKWGNCGEGKIEHSWNKTGDGGDASCRIPWMVRELSMPKPTKPSRTRQLEVSSVLGGVNKHYNSEQVIQGVTDPKAQWEDTLSKDLFLCAHNAVLEKNISEALCIVGDMDSWEVSILSSSTSFLNKNKKSGVRVGMSQLVADMLESFLYLHTINLAPNFCLLHIEKKLQEIYSKSKTVAELLNSTDLCTIEYLTTRLDIGINDVPLLLSVATMHSPSISEKYGLSFT